MVVGSGLVAHAFSIYREKNDFVIFASGVSNSSTRDTAQFQREKTLLLHHLKEHQSAVFVYFSTCSIYDPEMHDSLYVRHKLEMEQLIKDHHSQYVIFRVSNLAGNTPNTHTILNYLYFHIKEHVPFRLWRGSERNIIDVEDAFRICHELLQQPSAIGQVFNVANPHNYHIETIVETFEQVLHKKANYTVIEKKSSPDIDMARTFALAPHLSAIFTDNYLQGIIHKYYSP